MSSLWTARHPSLPKSSGSHAPQSVCHLPDPPAGRVQASGRPAGARHPDGTGVQVDRLWQLKIGEGGQASVADSIDPFEMQEALCAMLGYRLQGGTLAFYDHETLLASVPCTGEGLDADPVRIGEQLTYLPGDTLKVRFTPGLRAADGGALDYEGMPDLEATVTWTEDGFALSDLQVVE